MTHASWLKYLEATLRNLSKKENKGGNGKFKSSGKQSDG